MSKMPRLTRMLSQCIMTISALIVVLSFALTVSVSAPYLIDPNFYSGFFGDRDPSGVRFWPTLVHISSGITALLIGPLQFSGRLRTAKPRLHRFIGNIYVIAALASGGAALLLVPHTLGGLRNGLGFATLAILWVTATLVALWHIRNRRVYAHRCWMVLSFALAVSGVSLRAQLVFFVGALGMEFASAYAIVAWSCWLPNLPLATAWICLRRDRWPENGRNDREN